MPTGPQRHRLLWLTRHIYRTHYSTRRVPALRQTLAASNATKLPPRPRNVAGAAPNLDVAAAIYDSSDEFADAENLASDMEIPSSSVSCRIKAPYPVDFSNTFKSPNPPSVFKSPNSLCWRRPHRNMRKGTLYFCCWHVQYYTIRVISLFSVSAPYLTRFAISGGKMLKQKLAGLLLYTTIMLLRWRSG
jgi:hypothetical protein